MQVVEEDRRTPEDRTEELIAELHARVRSLENQLRQERAANRENRRIIADLTRRMPELPAPPEAGSYSKPARRRFSSWWKERFGAAMVGVVTAIAVLSANGGENPLRVAEPGPFGEEQASVPTPTTEPAPQPSGGAGGGGGGGFAPAPAASEPAPLPSGGGGGGGGAYEEPVPVRPTAQSAEDGS